MKDLLFQTKLLWHTGILNWMPFQLQSLQRVLPLLSSLFLYSQNTCEQFYDFYSFSILLICLSSFLTTPGHLTFFGEPFKVDNLFFISANLCSLLIFLISFPLLYKYYIIIFFKNQMFLSDAAGGIPRRTYIIEFLNRYSETGKEEKSFV